MTVIAITHETGTLGSGLAVMLARHFGLAYAGKGALENRVVERLTETRAAYGGAVRANVLFDDLASVTDLTLSRHAADAVAEFAAYGNIVLRGWGATNILRTAPHVLRIRFVAPMSFRREVLAATCRGQSHRDFCQMISDSDRMLSTNQEPIFGPGWRFATSYDLVLRSHQLTLKQVTDLVEQALQEKSRAQAFNARSPSVVQ